MRVGNRHIAIGEEEKNCSWPSTLWPRRITRNQESLKEQALEVSVSRTCSDQFIQQKQKRRWRLLKAHMLNPATERYDDLKSSNNNVYSTIDMWYDVF